MNGKNIKDTEKKYINMNIFCLKKEEWAWILLALVITLLHIWMYYFQPLPTEFMEVKGVVEDIEYPRGKIRIKFKNNKNWFTSYGFISLRHAVKVGDYLELIIDKAELGTRHQCILQIKKNGKYIITKEETMDSLKLRKHLEFYWMVLSPLIAVFGILYERSRRRKGKQKSKKERFMEKQKKKHK